MNLAQRINSINNLLFRYLILNTWILAKTIKYLTNNHFNFQFNNRLSDSFALL